MVRVLVVDSSKPWVSFVNEFLGKESHVQIVGMAMDGPEVIAQARILRPDLVLMEISLPTLSGFETAEQIIALVPRTKLIFASIHREPLVVRAAFAVEGRGYATKSDAGRELSRLKQLLRVSGLLVEGWKVGSRLQ